MIENILDALDSILIVSLFGILIFLFMCAYYIFFETTWNGQTPGKRLIGIRMVRVGGRPLGFLGSTIRNIIRLADFLPLLYGVGVLVMFVDRQSRRLGDMAAGSLAVRERKGVTLDMLEVAPEAEAPVVAPADEQRIPNFRALRAEDFAMVERYLRRRTRINPEVRSRLDTIMLDGLEQRLGYPVQRDPTNIEQFLGRVAAEHLLVQRDPDALGRIKPTQTLPTPDAVPQEIERSVLITSDMDVPPRSSHESVLITSDMEETVRRNADEPRATTPFNASSTPDEPRTATVPLEPSTESTNGPSFETQPSDSATRDQS